MACPRVRAGDEFLTSQKCVLCRRPDKFLVSPPFSREVVCEVHGVLERDANSARNMMFLADYFLREGKRPDYLSPGATKTAIKKQQKQQKAVKKQSAQARRQAFGDDAFVGGRSGVPPTRERKPGSAWLSTCIHVRGLTIVVCRVGSSACIDGAHAW